jgi:hypothetical protein
VAFGTRIAKLECGDQFLLPNWIRKSHRAKLMRAFVAEFQEIIPKMPSRTWMYRTMDWVASRDMVSLAGLDNTDQKGKEAMEGLISLTNAIVAQQVIPERFQKHLPKIEQVRDFLKHSFKNCCKACEWHANYMPALVL